MAAPVNTDFGVTLEWTRGQDQVTAQRLAELGYVPVNLPDVPPDTYFRHALFPSLLTRRVASIEEAYACGGLFLADTTRAWYAVGPTLADALQGKKVGHNTRVLPLDDRAIVEERPTKDAATIVEYKRHGTDYTVILETVRHHPRVRKFANRSLTLRHSTGSWVRPSLVDASSPRFHAMGLVTGANDGFGINATTGDAEARNIVGVFTSPPQGLSSSGLLSPVSRCWGYLATDVVATKTLPEILRPQREKFVNREDAPPEYIERANALWEDFVNAYPALKPTVRLNTIFHDGVLATSIAQGCDFDAMTETADPQSPAFSLAQTISRSPAYVEVTDSNVPTGSTWSQETIQTVPNYPAARGCRMVMNGPLVTAPGSPFPLCNDLFKSPQVNIDWGIGVIDDLHTIDIVHGQMLGAKLVTGTAPVANTSYESLYEYVADDIGHYRGLKFATPVTINPGVVDPVYEASEAYVLSRAADQMAAMDPAKPELSAQFVINRGTLGLHTQMFAHAFDKTVLDSFS